MTKGQASASIWTSPNLSRAFDGASFWGGLEGITTKERHELVPGVFVEPCYGTIFAHPILAVAPPEHPGAPHPAPWFACRGGHRTIEVRCQLYLPADTEPFYVNRAASAWLAAASLRLLLCAPIRLAVLSDMPFEKLSSDWKLQPMLVSMEQAGSYTVNADLDVSGYLNAWRTLLSAMMVAMRGDRFQRAFSYMDAAWWAGSSAAFLVSLWTSLEALLLEPNTVGIKRSLARNISELLASSPSERDRIYNKVISLYEIRCDSAHGALHPDLGPVEASARLAGAVFYAKAGEAIGESW